MYYNVLIDDGINVDKNLLTVQLLNIKQIQTLRYCIFYLKKYKSRNYTIFKILVYFILKQNCIFLQYLSFFLFIKVMIWFLFYKHFYFTKLKRKIGRSLLINCLLVFILLCFPLKLL